MKVFNTCVIIIRRNLSRLLVYIGIFLSAGFLLSQTWQDPADVDFSASQPPFTILNEDRSSPILDGLLSHLKAHGTEVYLAQTQEALQDAAFFHETEYILTIPAGFTDALLEGETALLDTVTFPDSASGYYLDALVNAYLNQIRVYSGSLPRLSEDELAARVLQNLSKSASAEVHHFLDSTPAPVVYLVYYRFVAYLLTVLIITCVSIVLRRFKQPDLQLRCQCAPLRPLSMSAQLLFFGLLLSILLWAVMSGAGLIAYRRQLEGMEPKLVALTLLNSLCYTMVCFPLALCVGRTVRSENAQSIASNLISLVLAFLGGIFVSTELLGEALTQVCRLVPTWWYSSALDRICSLNSLDDASLRPIYHSMAIQLGFAAALLCCFLLINRRMNEAVEASGTDRTEREE